MKTFAKLLIIIYYIIGYYGACNIKIVECEQILAISPRAGKSHWNILKGIVTALTEHGHNVTVFTPFLDGNRENYTEIDISKEIIPLVHLDIGVVRKLFTRYSDLIDSANRFSREMCKKMYTNNAIKNIIANNTYTHFDVIIVELTASECFSYLSAKLNIPLIYVTAPPLMTYVERSVVGYYPNPAVVSHTFSDHSVPRTFTQRFTNAALFVYTTCLLQCKFWYTSIVDRQPFDLVDPVKPSIVFSNAHFIMDTPRPQLQNVIPVGGIHLKPPERIPDDVLEFISNSTHGVIIFTLGSVLKTSSLPENIQDILFEVVEQLPQRVLLKYEDDIMVNRKRIPGNLMIKNWFPQRDILMHPNVKLFISHGGISGMYEAVDAGVPVLGFPLFYDQSRNLEHLVDAGMAVLLNLESVTKDTLLKTILELINNEKYMKNAKITSELFRDRPLSPAQTVEYWTRYAIRHKGEPHLKSSAFNLTWYQYFLLDVFIVISLIFSLIIYITYLVLYYGVYKLCVSMLSYIKLKLKSE